jgi:hypothetical protein
MGIARDIALLPAFRQSLQILGAFAFTKVSAGAALFLSWGKWRFYLILTQSPYDQQSCSRKPTLSLPL